MTRALLVALALVLAAPADARTWTVGPPPADFPFIAPAVAAASAGDVILVERRRLSRGSRARQAARDRRRGGPTLFGTGVGTVITIHAGGCEVRGPDHRRKRRGRDQRHGRGRADHVERQPHRRQPPAPRVLRHRRRRTRRTTRSPTTRSKACAERAFGRRGDGIYLYRAPENVLARNTIRDERDGIYFEYAPRGRAIDNVVSGSRYGLHDMFSDDTRIAGNTFSDSSAGANIMNSRRIRLERQPLRAQPRRRRRRADAEGQRQLDRPRQRVRRTIRAACSSTDRRRTGSPTTCSAPTTRPWRCLRAPRRTCSAATSSATTGATSS